jgi:2-aminoethylphosphonate-pyruvate transaminase
VKADATMTAERESPLLLTPGPLTTSAATKQAMLRDWGSRDGDFIALTARIRQRLLSIAKAERTHTCVPLQGSGTFAVEAMLGTLVPRTGKVALLINGAYGRRMARICDLAGRAHADLTWPEDRPADPAALNDLLAEAPDIGHVAVVHCETTSGILNPLDAVAEVTARHGRKLLVDAMSSFGALEIDAGQTPFAALAASANKCLEGVPGVAYVLVEREALAAAEGNAPSLSLDLHDQWRGLEANGQWRFTPPTQVLAALDQALDAHQAEQGVAGRGARYGRNCEALVTGMRALGFETLLPDPLQAPIIVTFRMPADPRFDFEVFYDGLAGRGYVIYPGKLTEAESFRIGCIGHVDEADMRGAVDAVRETLAEMGVESGAA